MDTEGLLTLTLNSICITVLVSYSKYALIMAFNCQINRARATTAISLIDEVVPFHQRTKTISLFSSLASFFACLLFQFARNRANRFALAFTCWSVTAASLIFVDRLILSRFSKFLYWTDFARPEYRNLDSNDCDDWCVCDIFSKSRRVLTPLARMYALKS